MTSRPRPTASPLALRAEPNVAPMIDVLLVLLIVFMAALPAQRKAMTGQLPPDEADPSAHAVGIVLEVGPGARYALNRRPIPAPRLAAELAAVYAGRPDKTLIVRGDPAARYQEVITAMDVARGAGVVVGIETRDH
jgi:biopolymer transport protein TolR